MKTQHETVIDGLEVTSTMLDFDDAAELNLELVQKLAPLVQLFALTAADELEGDKLNDAALPVIATVAQSMRPTEWSALMRRLLERTVVVAPDAEGKKIRLDLSQKTARNIAFQGRVLTSYKVVLFAIKINFADFIGALGPLGITVKGL